MAIIVCKNCGKSAEKREGSLFCSSRCKNEFWNSSLKSDSAGELRNLISDEKPKQVIPEKFIYRIVESPNPDLVCCQEEIKRLDEHYKRLVNQEKQLKIELSYLKNNDGGFSYLGGILGMSKGGLLGGGLGFLAGKIVDGIYEENTKDIVLKRIDETKLRLVELSKAISSTRIELMGFNGKLLTINRTIKNKIQQVNPEWLEYEKNQNDIKSKRSASNQGQNEPIPVDLSDKIISSQRLEQMVFKALNFQDKWREFIGQPSIEFFMVIHGRAGSGKSTFSVQLAYYLAENFGTVLYISGEEGFSKTLKDKVVSNDAISENLYFADLHDLDEILTNVPSNRFNFLIIDSLNNLKIDVFGIRRMRDAFKGSAMIAITQSTKDGKMRGSNEIIHDCDIEVMVEKGQAKSIKNRFHSTDRFFSVFERDTEEKANEKYTLATPKNIV